MIPYSWRCAEYVCVHINALRTPVFAPTCIFAYTATDVWSYLHIHTHMFSYIHTHSTRSIRHIQTHTHSFNIPYPPLSLYLSLSQRVWSCNKLSLPSQPAVFRHPHERNISKAYERVFKDEIGKQSKFSTRFKYVDIFVWGNYDCAVDSTVLLIPARWYHNCNLSTQTLGSFEPRPQGLLNPDLRFFYSACYNKVKATKNIRNNKEIFVNYGRDYKIHEAGVTSITNYIRWFHVHPVYCVPNLDVIQPIWNLDKQIHEGFSNYQR